MTAVQMIALRPFTFSHKRVSYKLSRDMIQSKYENFVPLAYFFNRSSTETVWEFIYKSLLDPTSCSQFLAKINSFALSNQVTFKSVLTNHIEIWDILHHRFKYSTGLKVKWVLILNIAEHEKWLHFLHFTKFKC